jgi:type I restriction enzyme S subunit
VNQEIMKYGLSETAVGKVCAVFARFPAIEKAVLYGSRAKGNYKTGSDIDLTLYGEALTSDLLPAIASALDDLHLPYTFDLSVFDELNHAKLREHIERVGVLFYQRADQGAVMKKGWQTKHLGDVATVGAGNSAPQDEALFKDGTIPFFRTADAGRIRFGDIFEAEDYLNEEGAKGLRHFAPGTILFPKSGASTFLNHRVMLGVDGCVSSHLATIVADEKQAHPRFLLYFLSTIAAQDLVQDHAYPSLNLPTIAGIGVHLPTLVEQHRIVGLLDEAFAGIATAQANAEKNLQNARALFASHLQSVFTQRGKGWVEKTLGDVCETTQGVQIPKNLHHKSPGENRRRYLYISDFEHDENLKYVEDIYPKKRVTENDLIVVNTGATAGKIFRGIDGVLSNNLFKVTLNQGIDGDFLYYFVTSSLFKEHQKKIVKGTANPHMGHENFKSTPANIPPLDVQLDTVAKLDELSAETQRFAGLYERKLAALEALKKSLLHQAFTGEL